MPHPSIAALVFDVLGTMVDEPAAVRDAIRTAYPTIDDATVADAFRRRQLHIEREIERIANGARAYAPSEVLDREAAEAVATALDIDDAVAVDIVSNATLRCRPWPDAAASLSRLAERFPVVALSNAGRATLLHLDFHAGLRWHHALSSEDVGHYKPDAEIYRHAVAATGVAPDRLLMVAAHAWDLRAAAREGMRTAFVARPVADPPTATDRFDLIVDDLDDLERQLA